MPDVPTSSSLIDQQLLFWLVLIVAAANTIGIISFWVMVKGKFQELGQFFTAGNYLQNLTVIIVVQTIGLLALAGVLDGEIVATLLGGIVGYVLGSIKTGNDS